jgi:cephalosporin hydroxylase
MTRTEGQARAYLGSAGLQAGGTLLDRIDRYRPRPLAYRRKHRERVGQWLMDLNREMMASGQWMGIPAAKNPIDAWIYQEIVHETRPDAIVELGSAYGGGTLFLAHLLDLIDANGPVVSVDISHADFRAEHQRIRTVTGSTGDRAVSDQVRELCSERRTMVIHDASHRANQVFEDLRTYSPLVAPGCYLIVEDGLTDVLPPRTIGAHPGRGPYRAVRGFLRTGAPFELDPRRERLGATNNPGGFLRRLAS